LRVGELEGAGRRLHGSLHIRIRQRTDFPTVFFTMLAMPWPAIQNPPQKIVETLNERQQLERFGELVLADRELHDRLRDTANQEAFIELAIRLGAERGCVFTAPVVEAALREQRRAWLERWL
jgi:hypothetical protein